MTFKLRYTTVARNPNLTNLELSLSIADKYKNLQVEYQEAVKTAQEQKQLITQLEEDLRSVNALSSMFRGTPEGQNVLTPGGEAEMVAEVVKDVAAPVAITIDPASKTAADSLLPIIQSQRERYRLRAQELEAQTLGQQQQVSLLQNEIDKLRSDNVKLYEKIRFLQSYPQSNTTRDDGTEHRYATHYEEKLDPFSKFSRTEKQRRYMNLKPYDKITLSMSVTFEVQRTQSLLRQYERIFNRKWETYTTFADTAFMLQDKNRKGRFILGNKTARTVTFFYTLLLHTLIFLVLYKLAHTESCKRDMAADWHEKYADHMMKVHGHADKHG